MNTDLKDHVEKLLDNYLDREREIDVLHYELKHPASSSEDEQIYAMALARNDGLGRSGGHVSDKTMYIALNYQEKTNKMNSDTVREIAVRLMRLEQEQNRLNYYISLLESMQAEVLRLLYIERLKRKEAERALGRSSKTVRKLRNDALDALVKMYECAVNNL